MTVSAEDPVHTGFDQLRFDPVGDNVHMAGRVSFVIRMGRGKGRFDSCRFIADPELLRTLNSGTISDMDDLVRRNTEIKASFVCGDEREHGKRKNLNFGHTVGHAIERLSGYTVPHGEAVAIGMALICRAGERLGYTPVGMYETVCTLLGRFHLPTECPYTADQLFSAAAADKKRSGGEIDIVILKEPGHSEPMRIPFTDLLEWMEAGL